MWGVRCEVWGQLNKDYRQNIIFFLVPTIFLSQTNNYNVIHRKTQSNVWNSQPFPFKDYSQNINWYKSVQIAEKTLHCTYQTEHFGWRHSILLQFRTDETWISLWQVETHWRFQENHNWSWPWEKNGYMKKNTNMNDNKSSVWFLMPQFIWQSLKLMVCKIRSKLQQG